jgi:nitrogenase molybdenum-iron protein alpha/beta subunit
MKQKHTINGGSEKKTRRLRDVVKKEHFKDRKGA